MEHLRERAAAMLHGAHITSFVYVDDKFGNTIVDKERAKVYVGEHLPETAFITMPDLWEEQFDDWWNETPSAERQETCASWGVKAENADELKAKFESVLPAAIEQHYLTPEMFAQERDALMATLDANHQLLLLVDHKLEDYGRDGEAILEQVSRRETVNCAIFSGTFRIEGEIDKWNSSQDKSNVYSLSKDRLSSDDDNEILEGLRSVLWLKQISRVKNHAKEIFDEASEFMKSQLDDIDPATFHKIVLDRSEKEGCWEFETLLRMAYAYLGKGIKKKMSDGGFAGFQTLTSNLRQIKRDAMANKVNNSVVKLISDEESYESGDYINNIFSQVSNGDIFKIGQSMREYILLCQPCNLEIRPNGKRKKEHFDQYYLVPLRVLANGEEPRAFENKLKKTEDGRVMVAELANYHRVSLSMLDLVSFNANGISTIDLKQTTATHPYKDVIQKNMMLRYGVIWQKVKDYKEKYDKIQSLEISKLDKDYLGKEFCRPFEMGDNVVAKHPQKVQGKPDVFDFQVARLRRYKDPYAKDLLSLFMDYLSRPGYPMELDLIDDL